MTTRSSAGTPAPASSRATSSPLTWKSAPNLLWSSASEVIDARGSPRMIAPCMTAVRRGVLFITLFVASSVIADDWPQWRGPNRDAVLRDNGWAKTFPTNGLQTVWRIPIRPGYSGPAVVGDSL